MDNPYRPSDFLADLLHLFDDAGNKDLTVDAALVGDLREVLRVVVNNVQIMERYLGALDNPASSSGDNVIPFPAKARPHAALVSDGGAA